jgi:voltage-gated potassium channel
MFKLIEYTSVFALMRMVVINKSKELVLSMGIVIFLIFLSSCIMFFAEHEVQPDKFKSIPDTMYWAVATVTTIGYGDIYPVTIIGKSITCIIAILGVLVIAIPTGIFASGFSETITASTEEKDRIQELERLGVLYERGFLTKEEFNTEKTKILQ